MAKTDNLRRRRNFCKICHKNIHGNAYKFKAHLFKHNAVEARYKCDFCSRLFFRSDSYSKHVQKHLGVVTAKRFICDYCDRGFVIKNNLITHLKRIHDDGLDTKLGKFNCNVCDLNYCERRLLDHHIRKMHFTNELSTPPSHTDKSINESWIEKVVNKKTCVLMTKVNDNVIVIKRLKINDAKTNDVKVKPDCYSTPTTDQYSKAVCDYCRKEMLKKSLRVHIKEKHTNIRKYLCIKCKVTFKRHYQLVDHKCGKVRVRKYKENTRVLA